MKYSRFFHFCACNPATLTTAVIGQPCLLNTMYNVHVHNLSFQTVQKGPPTSGLSGNPESSRQKKPDIRSARCSTYHFTAHYESTNSTAPLLFKNLNCCFPRPSACVLTNHSCSDLPCRIELQQCSHHPLMLGPALCIGQSCSTVQYSVPTTR